MEQDMKNKEKGTVPKPKDFLHDDFPWSHFASLGMHKLINQWELQSVSKAITLQDQPNFIKSPPKVEVNNHLFDTYNLFYIITTTEVNGIQGYKQIDFGFAGIKRNTYDKCIC